jgi:hypothetical protein
MHSFILDRSVLSPLLSIMNVLESDTGEVPVMTWITTKNCWDLMSQHLETKEICFLTILSEHSSIWDRSALKNEFMNPNSRRGY